MQHTSKLFWWGGVSMTWQIINADCIEAMKQMEGESIDAVVTDPPYELGFMGKGWDATGIANSFEMWSEVLRVLKPGGHVLAFSGTRTYHRMVCAIEDAGFEIRDQIAWMFGSGFPKSLDVSKAIDKQDAVAERHARSKRSQEWLRQHVSPQQVNEATGTQMGHILTTHPNQPAVPTPTMLDQLRPYLPAVPDWLEALVIERRVESEQFAAREVVGTKLAGIATPGDSDRHTVGGSRAVEVDVTEAHTPEARQWQGWGTALKPAFEPIVVARKPLIGTVATNVLEWGTGSINVDGCRIGTGSDSEGREGRSGEANSRGNRPCRLHGLRQDGSQVEVERGEGQVATDLRPQVSRGFDDRAGKPSLSRNLGGQANGVPDGAPRPAGRRDASADPEGTARGTGASRGDGEDAGALADKSGARSPRQRGQDGQPAGELDADGLGGTQPGAPGGIAPDGAVGGGEQGAARCTCGEVAGRWPANVILDEVAGAMLDEQTGELPGMARGTLRRGATTGVGWGQNGIYGTAAPHEAEAGYGDTGGASRFFYCAKTSSAERNAGLESFEPQHAPKGNHVGRDLENDGNHLGGLQGSVQRNVHPTVKPIALMRWLCRLVTPPGGTILDPFSGSGSTGCAAVLEGFDYIGLELEAEYVAIAEARIEWWREHPEGMELVDRIKAEKERAAVVDSGQLDMFGEAA